MILAPQISNNPSHDLTLLPLTTITMIALTIDIVWDRVLPLVCGYDSCVPYHKNINKSTSGGWIWRRSIINSSNLIFTWLATWWICLQWKPMPFKNTFKYWLRNPWVGTHEIHNRGNQWLHKMDLGPTKINKEKRKISKVISWNFMGYFFTEEHHDVFLFSMPLLWPISEKQNFYWYNNKEKQVLHISNYLPQQINR